MIAGVDEVVKPCRPVIAICNHKEPMGPGLKKPFLMEHLTVIIEN